MAASTSASCRTPLLALTPVFSNTASLAAVFR